MRDVLLTLADSFVQHTCTTHLGSCVCVLNHAHTSFTYTYRVVHACACKRCAALGSHLAATVTLRVRAYAYGTMCVCERRMVVDRGATFAQVSQRRRLYNGRTMHICIECWNTASSSDRIATTLEFTQQQQHTHSQNYIYIQCWVNRSKKSNDETYAHNSIYTYMNG